MEGLWLFLSLKSFSELLPILSCIEIVKHYSKSISDAVVQMKFTKKLLNLFNLLYFFWISPKAYWLVSNVWIFICWWIIDFNTGVHSFLWVIYLSGYSLWDSSRDRFEWSGLSKVSKIIKSSYEAFWIARIIYKQIDKKEERKKNKIMREWIMEDNISMHGSRWDNLRYQESSHLLNRT